MKEKTLILVHCKFAILDLYVSLSSKSMGTKHLDRKKKEKKQKTIHLEIYPHKIGQQTSNTVNCEREQ